MYHSCFLPPHRTTNAVTLFRGLSSLVADDARHATRT